MVKKSDNWASRYLHSDHHTDRHVRTVLDFENATGLTYPVPEIHVKRYHQPNSMAWGRGGYDDLDDLDNYSTFRKAQRISSNAVEDGDVLTSASRRQDQRLLNDITTRLVNAPYSQPVHVPRTHRRPPLSPASVRKVVVPGRPASTYSVGGYRAASVPPRDASLESEVEDFLIGPAPGSSRRPSRTTRASSVAPRVSYESTGRSYRAASEPPLPPVADLAVRQARRYLTRVENELGVGSIGGVDPYGVDDIPVVTRSYRSGERPSRRSSYAAPVVQEHLTYDNGPYVPSAMTSHLKRRHSEIFDAPTPVILMRERARGRHVPDYRPIAVVRPHRRRRASSLPPRYTRRDRDVDEYLSGLGHARRFYDDTYLDYVPPRRAYQPYHVRPYYLPSYPAHIHHPPRPVYAPVSAAYFYDDPAYGLYESYRSPVPLRAHHPVMPTRTTSVASVGGHARVRVGSLPPPSPTFNRRGFSTDYDLEDRLESLSVPDRPPKSSYSELRHQAALARNKMDKHKVLLDRYLPIYMGPENEVEYEVDYKFGELADRMPHLDPYRPPMPYHPPEVTPYKPIRTGGSGDVYGKPPSGYGFCPKMSDTRRRIRDVICSTRNDPSYYD